VQYTSNSPCCICCMDQTFLDRLLVRPIAGRPDPGLAALPDGLRSLLVSTQATRQLLVYRPSLTAACDCSTSFDFADASVYTTAPKAGLNGTRLASTMLTVRVKVTNSGKMLGATPVIVTFGKLVSHPAMIPQSARSSVHATLTLAADGRPVASSATSA
jgi:hypothetical protein